MQKKNILITGGAGYIGSHIAKVIFEDGYYPLILDNLITGHLKSVNWGKLIAGDIIDDKLVKDLKLLTNPIFDPIREDSEFIRLIKKTKLKKMDSL